MRKIYTARQLLFEGNEGIDFRTLIDNLDEDDIIGVIEDYSDQFNKQKIERVVRDLTSVDTFIEGLVKLKADGCLEAFIACEQDSVIRIKELLDL